jgi:hypothetical protein
MSEWEQALDDRITALEQVARDHAKQMHALREALRRAAGAANQQALRQAAQAHARRIRRAVRGLPSFATDTSSAQGAASVARHNGQMMADALEGLQLPEAQSSGASALQAAQRAARLAAEDRTLFGEPSARYQDINQARRVIEEELRWVEQQMEAVRRDTAQRARESIDRAARSEADLANRTGRLAESGRTGAVPLPHATTEMLEQAQKRMRDAARALRAADTRRGPQAQDEAQRLLEMASEAQGQGRHDEQPSAPRPGAKSARPAGPSTERMHIPGADAFHSPEEFRRRVLEGLGDSSDPRLREAVRRYAEGLLQ